MLRRMISSSGAPSAAAGPISGQLELHGNAEPGELDSEFLEHRDGVFVARREHP